MQPSASQLLESGRTTSNLQSLRNNAIKLLLLTLLALCVALVLFRLYFPGYVAPLLIWHEDHYTYVGMSAQGYGLGRYFTSYPRPFAHVFIDLCGRLGTQGVLAPVFGLAFINAALVILYAQRIIGRMPHLITVITYFILVFANPQFYWSIKEDPFAVPSFTCLIVAFHCWLSFANRRSWLAFAGTVIFGCAMVQFKETYAPSLAIFFAAYAAFDRRNRFPALAALGIVGGVAAASFIHTSHVWKLFHESQTINDPYYSSFAPRSLAKGMKVFLSRLVAPLPVIAMLGGIAWVYKKNKLIFLSCTVAIACGVAALLANSTLPNHFLDQYAWLGALLLYSPVLLLSALLTRLTLRNQLASVAVAVFICGMALYEYRPKPYSRANQLLSFEATSRNMLQSLPLLKKSASPESNSLVVGMDMEFYPFRTPSFVLKEMGLGRLWTVIVPDKIPEVADATTRLVHRDNFHQLQGKSYDHVFVYAPNGTLTEIYDRSNWSALQSTAATRAIGADIVSQVQRVSSPSATHPRTTYLYAVPDPIVLAAGDPSKFGQTVVQWVAPGVRHTEIRLNQENGPLFAAGGSFGMAATNRWVTNDIKFFLEDAATHRVLKTIQVHVITQPQPISEPDKLRPAR